VVRAPAGAAAFTADVGRVVVSNRDSTAVFDVMIPRIAPQVEIRVTGTVIFTKERSRVLVGGRTPGPGPWLLPISPD
jgi:hypothetical protein